MRRSEERFVLQTQQAAAFQNVFACQVMELRGAHRSLKFGSADHLAKELVGFKKDVILKENIANPDDAFFT